MGLSLWLGNNEKADGTTTVNLHPISNSPERASYVELGEVAYNQKKQNEAIQYISTHPGRTLLLTSRRFVAIWAGGAVHPVHDFLTSHSLWFRWVLGFNVLAAIAGAAGIVILYRAGNHFAFPAAVFPLIYPLPYYLTLAPPRYRHPIDPVLLLLAGVTLLAVCENRIKRFKTCVPPAKQTIDPT